MFKVDEVDAKVEMSLFQDHTYSEAFTSAPTIKLGHQVYVQIQVTEPEDFFNLKVNECWATQSAKPNDKSGFVHSMLVNGYVLTLNCKNSYHFVNVKSIFFFYMSKVYK